MLPASWSKRSSCGRISTSCTLLIPKTSRTQKYFPVNGYFSWDGGGCNCGRASVAIVGSDEALVSGRVVNKDGDPIPAVQVAVNGPSNYLAATGSDGSYALVVKSGRYRIGPLGRSVSPKRPPGIEPGSRDVTVKYGRAVTADFMVDAGLIVQLKLDRRQVPADGFQIVQGTVTVTEFGRPRAGAAVTLWPSPEENPDRAVRRGVRATICSGGSRVWPGGTIGDPNGDPVIVTTDANGSYSFTLNVGTVPGRFDLSAWARNAKGELISGDGGDARDTATVEVETLAPAGSTSDFVAGLTNLRTAGLRLSADPNQLALDLARSSQGAPDMRGFAFAVVTGSWRKPLSLTPAVLIYRAADPPIIQRPNAVVANPDDLVVEPALWSGKIGSVALTDFATTLKDPKLTFPDPPTFTQWTTGKSVVGWNGTPQAMLLATQSFQYFGWPYPNSAPGSCS